MSSIERQCGGRKARLLGGGAALVVAGGRDIDEGVVQEDAMSLFVVLALSEALREVVGGCGTLGENPEGVPAIFSGPRRL